MKKNKNIDLNDDQREIVRFVVILAIILVIVLAIYFISKGITSKNEYHYDEVTEGEIDYNKTNIGTLLNKAEKEYYVALYKNDNPNALYYSSLMGVYVNTPDALKVYYCDLNNKLNEEYYAEDGKTNPDAKTIAELKLGDFTLIKVKNGKIVNYYEDIEKVKEDLKLNSVLRSEK